MMTCQCSGEARSERVPARSARFIARIATPLQFQLIAPNGPAPTCRASVPGDVLQHYATPNASQLSPFGLRSHSVSARRLAAALGLSRGAQTRRATALQ